MRNRTSLPAEVCIREFQLDKDYQPVIELWENAGPGIHVRRSDQKNELEKKLTRDPDLFLVAEAGQQIIGTVMGGFDGRRGMVYHLAVESSFRKLGIGAALMEELEHRFKEKGCIRSYLLVTRDNQEAIRFYKEHGWEPMDILTFGKDIA
jgi:ribosomal protein S18 acetylase RimI-like enzyme